MKKIEYIIEKELKKRRIRYKKRRAKRLWKGKEITFINNNNTIFIFIYDRLQRRSGIIYNVSIIIERILGGLHIDWFNFNENRDMVRGLKLLKKECLSK